mgnify:CR=1 FL=1
MKNKLLLVPLISQVLFVSQSYSKTLKDLIATNQHQDIACIKHQIRDCFVAYQDGSCTIDIKYYSSPTSEQPVYTQTEEVHMRVKSGESINSPTEIRDFVSGLTDGISTKISRAATAADFNESRERLDQVLKSGDVSNGIIPQCKN